MFRALLVAAAGAVAALSFAAPATATPCDDGLSGVQYGLEFASNEPVEYCLSVCHDRCDFWLDSPHPGDFQACMSDCMDACPKDE